MADHHHWHRRATVRTAAARPANDFSGLHFPPELTPEVMHPRVRALGPEATRILLYHALYRYLRFTQLLELRVIAVVAQDIASRRVLGHLGPVGRIEAQQLHVDEAYHALVCDELLYELERETGTGPLPTSPPFLEPLEHLERHAPPTCAPLVRLLFAVVSETLITTTLGSLPNDTRVMPSVRALVGEHLEDERRHHAWFSALFLSCWGRLDPDVAAFFAPRLPTFIAWYHTPDAAGRTAALEAVGLPPDEARSVLAEIGDPLPVGARHTVSLFHRVGIATPEMAPVAS